MLEVVRIFEGFWRFPHQIHNLTEQFGDFLLYRYRFLIFFAKLGHLFISFQPFFENVGRKSGLAEPSTEREVLPEPTFFADPNVVLLDFFDEFNILVKGVVLTLIEIGIPILTLPVSEIFISVLFQVL